MDQPTILIVSDDAAFAHVLTARWQNEALVPAFTLMGSDLCRDLDLDAFSVAVVGTVHSDALPLVLNALNPGDKAVLLVCENLAHAHALRDARSRASLLMRQEGWPDVVVMLASEVMRRQEAMARLRQFEQTNAVLERQAALGSYILEMRHTLNNALTSILGNAELLLIDPDPLPSGARSQIETVRNMAVRIHETLARFTSIDKELTAVERPFAGMSDKGRSQAAGAIV